MEKEIKPLSRRDNLVVQEVKDEILIYDLNAAKAFCLNKTSALVWQACDGSKSIGEIGESVGKKLKSVVSEDIVWLALEQLKKDNLLENKDEITGKFAGVSRREAIRKIGLGSAVALPIVASLVVPTSTMAQSSLLAPGVICTADAQCQSGRCRNPGCNPSGTSQICRTILECP
jgi:hypothetical protein